MLIGFIAAVVKPIQLKLAKTPGSQIASGQDWKLDASDIDRKATSKTKALVSARNRARLLH